MPPSQPRRRLRRRRRHPRAVERLRAADRLAASVAAAAGLEWVNSDADKVRAVQAGDGARAEAGRMCRASRKPAVVVDEGPLVLVETRKDLSQIKLPFEQRSG